MLALFIGLYSYNSYKKETAAKNKCFFFYNGSLYYLDIKSKLLRMYSFAVYLHTDDTD